MPLQQQAGGFPTEHSGMLLATCDEVAANAGHRCHDFADPDDENTYVLAGHCRKNESYIVRPPQNLDDAVFFHRKLRG